MTGSEPRAAVVRGGGLDDFGPIIGRQRDGRRHQPHRLVKLVRRDTTLVVHHRLVTVNERQRGGGGGGGGGSRVVAVVATVLAVVAGYGSLPGLLGRARGLSRRGPLFLDLLRLEHLRVLRGGHQGRRGATRRVGGHEWQRGNLGVCTQKE